MRDSVNRNDYQFEALAPEFVASCVDSIRRQADATTVGDVFLAFPASLPAGTLTPMTPQVAQTAPSVEGLYAYYAMVVYILGKSLSPDTESAIAVKRPSALIRKRQLATSEYILTGDGKILPDNYGKVQGGWVRSTEPRVVIVTHLATLYSASSRPESLDSIVVNMDMLKNAGQSYIYYVYELLVACDWCLEIPILAAQYRHFSRMVNILTRQPQHIQPFYKMMMQDATKDVRRREIEHIVGVSIFYASQTRASITNYRISAECRPVIDAFIALAATKGITFREVTGQATIDVTAV
uniref:RNA-dependent RNA polymerase n=1 Tax=Grapevine-associated mononega-like virus 6 TaxID=2814370 RepID=A0A8F5MJE5_9MONO|nr:MAG: RNA-dependent RNA polymerase [Grapevine-associated mononega-like virus 6]